MNSPNDELPFEGMTVPQRHQAALKHTIAVAKELVPFRVSILQPAHPAERNRRLQRGAVDLGLEEVQALLSALLLKHLLAAAILHTLGPPPPKDAPEDAHNLRAIQEVHFRLDWMAEFASSDSVDAVRVDCKRLEEGHEPLTRVGTPQSGWIGRTLSCSSTIWPPRATRSPATCWSSSA